MYKTDEDAEKDLFNIGNNTDMMHEKFSDPYVTADGKERAYVKLVTLKTLWFNTGTLCNISCQNCYIESTPKNDRLVYIKAHEVKEYLAQVKALGWSLEEIGLTGGEPFMNPEIIEIMRVCLEEGYRLLVLTNAMRPMMRKKMQAGIKNLYEKFGTQMVFRVSLDHWDSECHDAERGKGSFKSTILGMQWLTSQGIKMAVAGRSLWHQDEESAREGYAKFYQELGFDIDAYDMGKTVLFPEMDASAEVPEITTQCWDILNKNPEDVMCATSRMVVKRKGAEKMTTLACTLLAYEPQFDFGPHPKDAEKTVYLNHPHCAKFCVLGGANCSVKASS